MGACRNNVNQSNFYPKRLQNQKFQKSPSAWFAKTIPKFKPGLCSNLQYIPLEKLTS